MATALAAIAALGSRTTSEVVRDMVREKAKEYHIWPPYLRQQQPASELVDAGVAYEVETA